MSQAWNFIQNGTAQGPVSTEALQDLLASGDLRWEDLVWRQGLADWMRADAVPELRPALPPPPPLSPAVQYRPPAAPLEPMGTAGALEALRATRPWVRFMGVLGILLVALMVVLALAFLVMDRGPLAFIPGPMRILFPLLYLFLASLHIPPVVFLNRYASRIGDLLGTRSPEDLEAALRSQKSFWKYVGILTLVVICLYALILLGGLVTALALSRGAHRF